MGNVGSKCDESSCVVSCQPGWEREGDYCYFWSTEKKNWFDAEETCISLGGHLASIATWEINDYMTRKKIPAWTGASTKEGTWTWADCSAWYFNPGWRDGEANTDGRNCMKLLHGNDEGRQGWNVESCSAEQRFVCSERICSGKGRHQEKIKV